MKKLIPIFIAIFSFGVSAEGSKCPLNGYWLSNEALTLESIANNANLREETVNLVTNDFFGKLAFYFECEKFESVYEEYAHEVEYKIIDQSPYSVTIAFEDHGQKLEHELRFRGECFSGPVQGHDFREFYCPISKEKYNQLWQKAAVIE